MSRCSEGGRDSCWGAAPAASLKVCLSPDNDRTAAISRGPLCADIPDLGVKLSTIILAGPTVLSAVGACPPHDGVRRRWWINVASAVALSGARKKSGDLTTATVPAGTSFPAMSREPVMLATR